MPYISVQRNCITISTDVDTDSLVNYKVSKIKLLNLKVS